MYSVEMLVHEGSKTYTFTGQHRKRTGQTLAWSDLASDRVADVPEFLSSSKPAVLRPVFLGNLKIAEGFGRPLNYFSLCCSTVGLC
jgi:hypothetical protein